MILLATTILYDTIYYAFFNSIISCGIIACGELYRSGSIILKIKT